MKPLLAMVDTTMILISAGCDLGKKAALGQVSETGQVSSSDTMATSSNIDCAGLGGA